MTMGDGAGTRNANHGATSTRRALSTIATAPRWANHPAANAIPSTAFAATTARPAIWTTAMAGTATRVSTRPATVIRENVAALTRSSAVSTAAGGATDAASPSNHPGTAGARGRTFGSAAGPPQRTTE